MTNYNFELDEPIAKKTELEMIEIFKNKFGAKLISRCSTNEYDFKMESAAGKQFTIEVKEDFIHAITGNVGVEYQSRGKLSGISVSKADYYLYVLHNSDGTKSAYLLRTNTLKKMIANKEYFRIVDGGDEDSHSMNYLFRDYIFIKDAKKIM